MRRSLLFLVLLLTLAARAAAQALPPMPGAGPDDFVLGGLGLAGMPSDPKEGPSFKVRLALAGGPAEGLLAEGDAILGAERRPLAKGDDVLLALEAAIERAEASAAGDLEILVSRKGGKTAPVKVKLAALGAHSKTCPRACKKCERVAAQAVDFLVKQQAADGSFPTDLGGENGKVVMTSLAGLALLAAGAAPESVERALVYVIAHAGDEEARGGLPGGEGAKPAANWSQVNWQLAYAGIFLAEAAARAKSEPVLEKLATVTAALAVNQEASGGWAHGPGGPNALGYLELEIMSNMAVLELGLARRSKVPVDAKLLAAGLRYVEDCAAGDGGIANSTRPGQKGFGEAGRTAGALVAYAMCGQRQSPLFAKMGAYLRGHLKSLGAGHVSPTMHTLSGALASWQSGDPDFAAFWALYRPKIMAARGIAGSFTAFPTPETLGLKNNTDRACGPVWTRYASVRSRNVTKFAIPTSSTPQRSRSAKWAMQASDM